MALWFIADTHIFHKNVIPFDNRPFDNLYHHDRTIIDRWNEVVGPDDIVIHLGDFCLAGTSKIRQIYQELNGKLKILVVGNHDKSKFKMAQIFDVVVEQMIINFHGERVLLCHYPYSDPREAKDKLDKHKDKRPVNNGIWLIHGHTHPPVNKVNGKQINVNCALHNYYPVSEQEILKYMNKEWWELDKKVDK